MSLAGAALKYLCKAASQPKQVEHDPSLPDLQVRLSASSFAPYATDVVRDADRASFAQQPFLVPIDAIPPDGLRLEVYDDDDTEKPELIGAVRLSRDEVVSAAGRPVLVKSDPQAVFEIVVSPYGGSGPQDVAMPASEGTRDSPAPVLAGEVVLVKAAGDYQVGSFYDAHVGPAGYPGGGPKGYNFKYEPLSSAPHACAFFLLGQRKRFATLTTPCGSSIAPVGGSLVVGINDDEPGNNKGTVAFSVARRPPTV
ncbi:MAG: C2 domain-containing protein, partial [Polyangiaceae bacterium]